MASTPPRRSPRHHVSSNDSSPAFKRVRRNDPRDYASVKQLFERTHFKCNSTFYALNSDDKWVAFGQVPFKTAFEHIQYDEPRKGGAETKCFIATWFKDDLMRRYDKVACLPEPLPVKKGTFNLWNGLPLSHLPHSNEAERLYFKEDLDRVIDHILAVAGDNKVYQQFVLHWIASIIQFPGNKTKIILIIKSVEKGVGKGVFKDILWALLGGRDYCYHTEDPGKQLCGGFNNTLRDKLLITLDEPSQGIIAPIVEALKSMVTEPTQNIRALYKEMDEGMPSFSNFVMLTNRDINWEHNDRRPLFLEVSDRFKGKQDEHFTPLYGSLKDERFCRVLYEYFHEMDISKVILERDRPITELQRVNEARSCPLEIQFLIHFGWFDRMFVDTATGYDKVELKVLGKELHQEYMRFVESHRDFKPLNAIQFGIRLKERVREGMEGLIKGKDHRGITYTFQVKVLKKWLVKNNYYDDEKLANDGRTIDNIGHHFPSIQY